MKNAMKLLAPVLVIALAACGGSDSDSGGAAAAPPATPVEAFDTNGLLGQESYVAKSQTSILNGGGEIGGTVTLGGQVCALPFELRFSDTRTGETTRVLFTDLSGEYYIWPAPGTYVLQAILSDGRTSQTATVSIETEQNRRADLAIP